MRSLKDTILKNFSIIFLIAIVSPIFSEEIFIINKESYKKEYLYGENILAEFNLELIYDKILPEKYIVSIITDVRDPIIKINGKSFEKGFVEEELGGNVKSVKIVIVGDTPSIKIRDSAKESLKGENILLAKITVKAIYKNRTLKQEDVRYVRIVPNNDVKKLLEDINDIENELMNLDIIYKKLEMSGKRNEKLGNYISIIRSKLNEIIENFNKEKYERVKLLILETKKYIREAKGLIKFKYEYLIPVIVLILTIVVLIIIKKRRERL